MQSFDTRGDKNFIKGTSFDFESSANFSRYHERGRGDVQEDVEVPEYDAEEG